MGFAEEITKQLKFKKTSLDGPSDKPQTLSARLRFLRRRIVLKGTSNISVPLGVVLFFPLLILVLILVLFLRHPSSPARILIPSGAPPSIRKISEKYDKPRVGCLEPDVDGPRANAAFVVLARNKELEGVIQSIRSIERHFNRWFHYPYVFLNDGEFNSTFRETVQNHTSSVVEFGQIDPEHWNFPEWADPAVTKEAIARQGDEAIMYGGLESYHKMCRFYSGHFYKHPLLQKYKWYWRLEPEIKYFCDITYDPFMFMEKNKKTYGFVIAVKELKETVPNLFRYASAYKRNNNFTSKGLWEMFLEPDPEADKPQPTQDAKKKNIPDEILKMDAGKGKPADVDPDSMENERYNMCHFWSNFEIARLDWFQSKEYEDFFQMMDKSGGFWYERWGDAPIHSLAAGILLGVSDVHYFRDFGYRHTTIQHCPANAPARQLPRPKFIEPYLDKKKAKEEDAYWDNWDSVKENGVGCRCRCDTDIVDVEGKEGSCMNEWVGVAGGWASP